MIFGQLLFWVKLLIIIVYKIQNNVEFLDLDILEDFDYLFLFIYYLILIVEDKWFN